MPNAADQKGMVFDQADILGLIIPGAALVIGAALVFFPRAIHSYQSINFGGLGVLVLAALVAGQCLRVIAWTYFDKMRHNTPRRVFDDTFSRQHPSERATMQRALEEAYAVKLQYDERFLDLSMFMHIYALLRTDNRSGFVDRMERQYRMVSGLFVASVFVGVAYVLNFGNIKPNDVCDATWASVTWIAWGMLLLGTIVILVPATYANKLLAKAVVAVTSLLGSKYVMGFAIFSVALILYGMKRLDHYADGEVLILLGLLVLSVFLYVGSIRFANATAASLLVAFSAFITERATPRTER